MMLSKPESRDRTSKDGSRAKTVLCFDLDPDNVARWTAFLAGHSTAHPRQDVRFAPVMATTGLTPVYAMNVTSAGLRAVALIGLRPHRAWPNRWREALILSGPVGEDDTLLDLLDDLAGHPFFSRVGALRITPYRLDEKAEALDRQLAAAGWQPTEATPFRNTGLIDLASSPESILSRFSKSARREVRRAERQGIEVRAVASETAARLFFGSLARLARRRGLPVIGEAEWQSGWPELYVDPTIGTILGAWKGDIFLGGLRIYRSAHTAHGRHFTTETEALKALGNLRLAPLLWWSGMAWAHARGCRQFDVEGWSPSLPPDDRLHGIYKYKGEFAPRPAKRIGERELVFNRLLYGTGTFPAKAKSALKQNFPMLAQLFRRS